MRKLFAVVGAIVVFGLLVQSGTLHGRMCASSIVCVGAAGKSITFTPAP